MKRKLFIPFLIALTLMAGCSNHITPNKPEQTSVPNETETNPTTTPEEKERAESLSLDYVTHFLNETDSAIKKKFVEEYAHSDTKSMLEASVDTTTPADKMFLNPKILEITETLSEGKIGYATLIHGDGENELIVMIKNGALLWGYHSNSVGEEKHNFDTLRILFTQPLPS